MTPFPKPPADAYGVLRKTRNDTAADGIVEQMQRRGFAVIKSCFTADELTSLGESFDAMHSAYIERHGEARLTRVNEIHTIRAPLTHAGEPFSRLALNSQLLDAIGTIIEGQFILNQQNGIINPPGQSYSQGVWHRDFPYQHFVSDRALGVNALFCVDDFTRENGGTFVLPYSHKFGAFPSDEYLADHALQLEAPAGSYILLNCMLFHAGGPNMSEAPRRAVNHVFNIPYFKQQINLPNNLDRDKFTAREQEVLGFRFQEPSTIEAYLGSRTEQEA